jgi:hypothetical protein
VDGAHKKTVATADEGGATRHLQGDRGRRFKAVEVWEARARTLDGPGRGPGGASSRQRLAPVAYAGGLRPETLRICQWLGIPHVDGGLRESTPEKATALCREHGIRFNIENHPEKSASEILAKIGGGNEWLGVCIDTGWLGTQGAPGTATIEACAPFVRHTHIKDVKAAGKHETCLLGEGCGRGGCWPRSAVKYAG